MNQSKVSEILHLPLDPADWTLEVVLDLETEDMLRKESKLGLIVVEELGMENKFDMSYIPIHEHCSQF